MNGACGHTYGHHSVWQFYDSRHTPANHPLLTWQEALQQPGVKQMQYGRRLIESRPIQNRIPRPELIVAREPSTGVPGEGRYRMVACGDAEGTYGMIYMPTEGRAFAVDMNLLRGREHQGVVAQPTHGQGAQAGHIQQSSCATHLRATAGPQRAGLDAGARRYCLPLPRSWLQEPALLSVTHRHTHGRNQRARFIVQHEHALCPNAAAHSSRRVPLHRVPRATTTST